VLFVLEEVGAGGGGNGLLVNSKRSSEEVI
jgi:hypothetical protein